MKRVVVAVGALLAVVVITALAADWRFMRPIVERVITAKLGRQVTLTGFRMSLLPHPRVHLEGLRIPSNPGSRESEMIAVDEAEIQIALGPALHGQLVLDGFALRGGEIYLARDGNGKANWALPGLPRPVAIRTISLDHLLVFYDDRKDDAIFNLRVGTNPVRATAKQYPLSMEFDGSYRGSRYKGTALSGNVLSLRDSLLRFPYKLEASIGSTRIKSEGELGDVLGELALDASLDMSGHTLSHLNPFLDIPLEAVAPFSLKGHVKRSGDTYAFTEVAATLGKSDLSGNALYETGPGRPYLNATLRSQLLDTREFQPLFGVPAERDMPPPDKPVARKPQTERKADPTRRLIPDFTFDEALLGRLDADIGFGASVLRNATLSIDNLKSQILIDNRVFKFASDSGYAGGALNTALVVDGRNQSPRAQATLNLAKARFNKLAPEVGLKRTPGTLGARLDLKAQGNSVNSLLAHADGTLTWAAATNDVGGLLDELLGSEAAQALANGKTPDRRGAQRCAAATFSVQQGSARSSLLAFDTGDTIVQGTGTLDLGQQSMALRLAAQPKETSASVRSPVAVTGSWVAPDTRIERTASGVTPQAISSAMLAPLLPMIETGIGRDAPCAGLLGTETRATVREAKATRDTKSIREPAAPRHGARRR